ncbi:MAG: ATP-dependent Clp protease ATP-binding subunit [Chloroflexota bacterium]|nr:ATP-dependent Clp protease ATP-binding subunit [Chloroflexota bacterium]
MDRFTKKARQALLFAQEEAHSLNHSYIGTEHLLLGLMQEKKGIAGEVLREFGLNMRQLRRMVERSVGHGRQSAEGDLSLSPRTKRVIELAVDEARRMGHEYIGTEHLLLGLVREEGGVAVEIMRSLGVSPKQIRQRTKETIAARPSAARRSRVEEEKTPLLDKLAVDLTEMAEEGKLDPIIGRQEEIERVIQILARRTKNNPALIGEPGVGKTAIVEGLAQQIVAGQTPRPLLNKRLLQLDVGSLVAGTIYRGQFEERMKRATQELKSIDSILFIDELHMLVGAGAAGSRVDAANILKPALARGELQCIGATTIEEYRKYIESDRALERRFQPVSVDEPTVEETIEILYGIKDLYEDYHQVTMTDEAVRSAARMADRYVNDRYLPDKAIDLIDETGSRVRMYKSRGRTSLEDSFSDLRTLHQRREEAFEERDFAMAADLRDEEEKLRIQINQLRMKWKEGEERLAVTADDIAEVVSMWTGIPVARIASEESERLLHMEEVMHQRVVGQDKAIETLSKALRRARAGLKDPNRPIGSFIFLGPTGVGKTLSAKTLAEFMFGSENALIELDMSEFMERHNVARLIGSPPGYVGYEEEGQLTGALRKRPYSVILFDEIEKAHPEVFNMLLQIMEEGHLSDAKGRTVDFSNAVVIMTSNLGAELINQNTTLGFSVPHSEEQKAEADYKSMKEKVMGKLRRTFRPEFLNRVDEVIVFRALTKKQIFRIVDLELAQVEERLKEHAIQLELTEEAQARLAEEGYDPKFGARPIRRVIRQRIEDPLSEGILSGRFQEGDIVLIDISEEGEGKLTLTPQREPREEQVPELVPS